MSKSAVIVVDMLNDFITGSLACERAQRIIEPISQLIHAARTRGVPVIYTNDSHLPGLDHESKLWGEHALRGTQGAEIIPELAATDIDFIVPKRRYSGFFQTDLHALLTELGVDTLVITGVHAHMCVQHTAADAYMWGYKVILPTDGIEAFSDENYQDGLAYMKAFHGAEITDIESVIASFG